MGVLRGPGGLGPWVQNWAPSCPAQTNHSLSSPFLFQTFWSFEEGRAGACPGLGGAEGGPGCLVPSLLLLSRTGG